MKYFQFRRGLRVLRRRNPDKAAIIDQALSNEEICAEACAWAEEKFEGLSGGPFLDFLNWIITNGPALLEFITKLIELFSANNPAPVPA